MLRLVVLTAVVAASLAPGVALAQPSPEAERAFREGEVSYRLGRYEQAIASFEEAYRLSNAPKLLFNIAQACRKRFDVIGDPTDLRRARELYQTYLRLDPTTTQRTEVEGLLVEIEARLADPAVAAGLPLIEHRPPGPVLAGEPLELPVTVTRDPAHRVTQVVMRYRRRGAAGEFRETTAATGQPVRISAVSLPAQGAPYQVHYYLEGRATDGTPLANLGSATEPLVLEVQAPVAPSAERSRRRARRESGGSVFGTWWFWTITGAVVVGAAATTVVVLNTETTPDSDLGTIDLR
jgi:tetratricopeptide (TPR) repeat protein